MLMNNYIILIEVCSLVSIFGLIVNKKHLLISLLYLEAFILRLVIIIPMCLSIIISQSIFISIVLLSIGACEARLGLALLVMISRSYGSDLISGIFINKC
jgi:NADH-ubiquinone oxidoreductase chain 4L